jgi:hypothetical protein
MATRCTSVTAAAALALAVGGLTLTVGGADPPAAPEKPAAPGDRAEKAPQRPDSYWYYGPNGLWKTWTPAQREGRDTWILWTGGNQKFLRLATQLGGSKPVPVSLEFFRMLDSRNRGKRFQLFGLVNEPNCVAATEPDEYGLYLDRWKGDPYERKPGDEEKYADAPYKKGKYPYYPDPEAYPEYGEPTGVVGLRKFKNPKFDKAKWDVNKYFDQPWAVEPPYLVGFGCAFCHMSFNPLNPPADPENPRWENMAANMGNQYLREGDVFLARGRVVFGDRNPGPNRKTNPYDTAGLGKDSLLFH